ncbi:hypothetical protein HOA92_02670 [archaeon]|nr:hypothetical protein [archaeon]MBT6761918.1 hypothetical protein [archaeon]
MQYKTILKWSSKVQYKKGVPFLYLMKIFSQFLALEKGVVIESELILIDGKTAILTRLE